ncbi:LuxR C-terminal-related transcriptional regulator [Pseudalkalibacillus sp. R45]|uniref:LuxR C-terminal-related transcriptional regulator n=1 Tax=Pseudalkalibacillus sp. R45 TaxID=3457433 RepID=UPI003FCE3D85
MKGKLGIYIPVRFNTMLNRVLMNKITYITAPSGYGKTTLVNHWSQLSTSPFIWMEMTESFSDTKALVTHLNQVTNQLRSNDNVIVVDHIHRLKHPDAITELKNWMLQAPPDINLILLSRHAIPSMKYESDLQHQMLQIDTNEMKFTYDETNIWMSEQSTFELTEDQIMDLYEITDGCPALLQLAYQHLHQSDGPMIDRKGRVAPLLEEYVQKKWLSKLTEETLQHLRPLGTPPYFSFEFARKLVETDIETLFHDLEHYLLIKKNLVKNRWLYRFHPLIRAIINERITFYGNVEELAVKTAFFLESEGLLREAVEAAIRGDNPKLALKYIKKFAPEALLCQDFQTLNDWLGQLNTEQFSLDKEIKSLQDWILNLMNSSNDKGMNKILHSEKDQWTPFISLNQGSIPFISSPFGYTGDINKVLDKYQASSSQGRELAFSPFRQLALAEAYYELNDINAARRSSDQVWQLAKNTNDLPGLSIPTLWVDLLCHQAEGKDKKVHYIVEEIYYRSLQTTTPVWRRIGKASKTYVLLREGYLDDAEDWVAEQQEFLHINWNKWTCFEYFILARALLTFQEVEEASYLLSRMITSATYEMNHGIKLKRKILQTIAAIKLEHLSEAHAYLEDALEIGYQYGYKRAFLDEDPTLFSIFPDIKKELPDHLQRYANHLLQIVNREELKEVRGNPKMKEALTIREIEILKYIQNGLSNQAIGKQMYITEGTVKGHLNRIFKKLNVRNRVQAVKTAEKQLLV